VIIALVLGLGPADGLAKSASTPVLPGDLRVHDQRHQARRPAPTPKLTSTPKVTAKPVLPGDVRVHDNRVTGKSMSQERRAAAKANAAANAHEDQRLRELARQERQKAFVPFVTDFARSKATSTLADRAVGALTAQAQK
jgi:hypothetical protein